MSNLGGRFLAAGLCASATFFAFAGSVHAVPLQGSNGAISFYLDPFQLGPSEDKIYLDKGVGNTVTGNVGSPSGATIVDFSSKHKLDATNGFKNGEVTGAGHDKKDSSIFHRLNISVPGFTFEDLMFNVDLLENKLDESDLTIKVYGANNTLLDILKWKGDPDKWGKDGLTFLLFDTLGSTITSIVLFSRSGFEDISHFRISDLVDPPATPLPAAVWLFGTVLAGAAGIGCWRKRRTAVWAV
jgi:hypothetical protein